MRSDGFQCCLWIKPRTQAPRYVYEISTEQTQLTVPTKVAGCLRRIDHVRRKPTLQGLLAPGIYNISLKNEIGAYKYERRANHGTFAMVA